MKKGEKQSWNPRTTPEQIIERMERLVEESSSDSGETKPLDESVDPTAQKHRDCIRRKRPADDGPSYWRISAECHAERGSSSREVSTSSVIAM